MAIPSHKCLCRDIVTTRQRPANTMPELTEIYRFPVKGLGPEPLDTVELAAGRTLPFDRHWAIENGPGPFDPEHPAHVKKKHFLMLAGQAELARVRCRYDTAGHSLRIEVDGQDSGPVRLDDPAGHDALFSPLQSLLGEAVRGRLRIVHAPGQAMTDIPEPHISLINAASVRDLSARTGVDLDPLRFRGNLLIDGLAPWAEFDWVGRTIRIGDAVLTARSRIGRCAATSVDLATGVRDIDVPRALFEHFGHTQCGLYLSVETGGPIRRGDRVLLDAHAPTP